jgi:3-methylfumaryl-CoA hydratase
MTDSFESWIGKSVSFEDVVTQRLMDEFRATLAPHIFKPQNAAEAPPGLHWCIALPIHDIARLGPDGAEAKGTFLPPVPLPRRMWAGGKIETFSPLRLHHKVSRTATISEVKHRTGEAGPMCFVSVIHEIKTNGALAIRERHDILFREAARQALAPKAPEKPFVGDLEWRVDASPQLMFRFSAITFNSHRIHYDLPYAQNTEGYEGLLVHGPMQAALTLNQLAVLVGRVPKNFDYRCVSPLIAGQTFKVVGTKKGIAKIANAAGVITIEAEAHE